MWRVNGDGNIRTRSTCATYNAAYLKWCLGARRKLGARVLNSRLDDFIDLTHHDKSRLSHRGDVCVESGTRSAFCGEEAVGSLDKAPAAARWHLTWASASSVECKWAVDGPFSCEAARTANSRFEVRSAPTSPCSTLTNHARPFHHYSRASHLRESGKLLHVVLIQ